MISDAGPGAALVTLIVLPFIFSVPVAYAVGELSAAFPVEGGNYRWSLMAFGDFWGFQAGWWAWMSAVVVNSMFAVLFANYLRQWIPGMGAAGHWLACLALIWFMYALNVKGVRVVGSASIALSLILLAPFLVLVALGLSHWGRNPFSPFVAPHKSVLAGFGSAAALGIWLYSGFDKLSTAAEEVEDPRRSFPAALFFAAALTMLSYVLPPLAALAANDDWQAWSGAYFPTAAALIGGPWLGSAMLFGALCSNALLLNVTMLSASRVMQSTAEDGFLPESLARLTPRHGTPALALVLGSVVYSLFAFFDFTQLAIIYAWFQMGSYILLYVNVWALRRTRAETPRPFSVPFGRPGLFASLGLTCSLALLAIASSVLKGGKFSPAQAAIGVAALLSGPAAYRASKRWMSRERTA
jgi:amino acid transporter